MHSSHSQQRVTFCVKNCENSFSPSFPSDMSRSPATGAQKSTQFDVDAINQIVEEEIQLRRYGNTREIQGRAAKASEVFSVWERDRASVQFISSSLSHTDKLTSQMVCNPILRFKPCGGAFATLDNL